MKFYKDHYDVVIIGGALAGMSACLQLQAWGIKDILILEKHNMPGGLATDFVRNGFEIEATLHEMMSIGRPGKRLKVGQFFEDMGVDVDWLPVNECYRVALPNSGIDKILHHDYDDSYTTVAREIDEVCPGTYDKVHELMLLCRRVYDSMNILSVTPMSKVQMLLKHPDFVKTVGYTATEVINTFDLPKKAVEMLTPYWIYVGNRMDDLPFTIYAFLMADYFTGSYVCRGFSHEMSMKLQAKCEEQGAQYEFNQEVEKILVRDGKVYGVRTARGDEIHCDYVISGPYPNRVYSQMIEPLTEVPAGAIRMINNRKLSVTPVSVIMVIEGPRRRTASSTTPPSPAPPWTPTRSGRTIPTSPSPTTTSLPSASTTPIPHFPRAIPSSPSPRWSPPSPLKTSRKRTTSTSSAVWPAR